MTEGVNMLEIHSGNITGPLIANIKITGSSDWKTIKTPVSQITTGIQNIFVILKGNTPLSLDWIKFE